MKCIPGWNLFNFKCVQCHVVDNCLFDQDHDSTQNEVICGDGITQDLEECDDGNSIPFDGCFECLYQFEYNFVECRDGVCILLSELKESMIFNCDFGFHLIDQNCQSICG
ncbi:unnamed protein product (macronuclear) [Paramecium tetraurelia]|uniref:Uncharacterized protein n=1 Tax=Paramecium tetraurelia TaxID=5888 RepID=A0BJV2_PARTE|nr:uncharacterized protein GSPATT00029448001 [Paramecium tetraurelia]CAK58819.1 unnamed protein product [Paramecium tetraurelia]|eukprot:XP_001426217.1 hypothetical protein (macronuclear) [Paramecium tetraurelia strain d4-2]